MSGHLHSRSFTLMAKEESEIGFGLKYRHDWASENGKRRGVGRGWDLVGRIELAEPENGSMESGD
jgi:hypothetical protein